MEEDWSYLSEGKGLNFEEEMNLHIGGFPRSTKLSMGSDQRPLYDFDQNLLISDREAVGSMEMPLYGGKSTHEIPTFKEDESGSSISNPFIDRRNSSLIDLNRAIEFPRTLTNDKIRETSLNSIVSGAFLGKQARTTRNTRLVCQVYGCNKDLSSSKNYHKRHKVCDVHSKMPKVIVNGVERRFCQQCSRFHPLSEFDGDKRSCRRRLAGHNERRRKSHLGLTRKSPQLLQSSQGYTRTSANKSTVPSPDLFHCHTLYAKAAETLTPLGFPTRKPFLEAQGIYERYGSDGSTSGKAPAFQELSGVSLSSSSSLSSGGASSRALSLLSTESQELYHPHASNQSIGQMHCFYAMRHAGLAHPDMTLFQAPEILNTNTCLSSEPESTVDLFQLSSHLRRVEQQRNSFHVHNDNMEPDYPGLIYRQGFQAEH